jgi:hypothetical protein
VLDLENAMGLHARIKDEVIARLTANQKDIIANILTTRQNLRQVQSQLLNLHQAIQVEIDGGDKNKQSLRYEGYLHAHIDLAQRLQDDLEILNKRLADTEVAMDRFAGPVHVGPWPEGDGMSHAAILEDMKRFLNVLYWFGVALAVVFVCVAVSSILLLAGGPDSRPAIPKVAPTDRYRDVFKTVGIPSSSSTTSVYRASLIQALTGGGSHGTMEQSQWINTGGISITKVATAILNIVPYQTRKLMS